MKGSTAVLVCLLVGLAGGYGVGYAKYDPEITGYKIQIFSLTSEVSTLNRTVSSKQAQILTLESEKSGLKSDIFTKETQISTLQSEKSGLQSAVSTKETQISTLESEKSKLKSDLATAQETLTAASHNWWKFLLAISYTLLSSRSIL